MVSRTTFNINDGVHLERTLLDLASFHEGEIPTIISAAVVPVGLTRFRPQEDELIPISQSKALEVIQQVEALQQQFRQKMGSTFAWLADEWFLIARKELPPESHYEDYPQIGNGVGSIRQFIKEFHIKAKKLLPKHLPTNKKYSWVVGNAVEKAFIPLVDRLNSVKNLTVNLIALNSQYWGQDISVTGLLTGEDLLIGLQGKDLGDALLLPSVMLKHDEAKFLDDRTVIEVAETLQIEIIPVDGIEGLMLTIASNDTPNRVQFR
jgi:putative radical SAM enzyme (TIGR03279 family)